MHGSLPEESTYVLLSRINTRRPSSQRSPPLSKPRSSSSEGRLLHGRLRTRLTASSGRRRRRCRGMPFGRAGPLQSGGHPGPPPLPRGGGPPGAGAGRKRTVRTGRGSFPRPTGSCGSCCGSCGRSRRRRTRSSRGSGSGCPTARRARGTPLLQLQPMSVIGPRVPHRRLPHWQPAEARGGRGTTGPPGGWPQGDSCPGGGPMCRPWGGGTDSLTGRRGSGLVPSLHKPGKVRVGGWVGGDVGYAVWTHSALACFSIFSGICCCRVVLNNPKGWILLARCHRPVPGVSCGHHRVTQPLWLDAVGPVPGIS